MIPDIVVVAISSTYSRLAESERLGVFYATADGEILSSNRAFLRTLGCSEADLPLHIDDLTPPEYSALDEAKHNEVHWTGSGMPWRKEYIRADGSRVPVLVGVSLVEPREGNCICFAMDISQRDGEPQHLRDAQAACKEAFDDFQLIYFTIDSAGLIYAINGYGARRLGYSQDDLLGSPLATLIHPSDREMQQKHLHRAVATPPALQNCEIRAVCKNQDVLWLRASMRGIQGTDNSLAFVVCADITHQKAHDEQLEQYQNKLRALTAKTVLSEERERRSVAIGLHDRVGHRLACAKFRAATLLARESIPPEIKGAIDDICTEIDEAIDATRDLTADLSSPTLYDLGLCSALRALGEQTKRYRDLEIRVECSRLPASISQDTVVILHRVARELLFNIVKHAQAKRALIEVQATQEQLQLIVSDDGIGFATQACTPPPEGFGLFSIREQIRELKGNFHIGCGANGGTRAVATVRI